MLAEIDGRLDVPAHGLARRNSIAPFQGPQDPIHLLVGFLDAQRPGGRGARHPAHLVDEVEEALRANDRETSESEEFSLGAQD